MTTHSLPTPSKHPLHLLRAILRQCTYLPDPAARRYISKQVLDRFRKYAPVLPSPRSSKGDAKDRKEMKTMPSHVTPKRIESALITARRTYSTLVRANLGASRPLHKVLSHTYGRIGRRRHQLLQPLMVLDVPVDSSAVEKLAAQRMLPIKQRQDLSNWPPMSSQLKALSKSQRSHTFPPGLEINCRPAQLQIPATNAWGRPLPKCRERNLRLKQHGMLLEKTLPPLPEHEWLRLQQLVLGDGWKGPVPRRKRVGEDEQEVESELEGARFLTPDILHAALKGHFKTASDPGHVQKHDRPHHLTPRFMGRMWGKVFAQCPVIRQCIPPTNKCAPETQWQIEWGKIHGDYHRLSTVPSEAVDTMFGTGRLADDGKRITLKTLQTLKTSKTPKRSKAVSPDWIELDPIKLSAKMNSDRETSIAPVFV